VLLAGVALVGIVALLTTVMPTDLFGNPPPPPAHVAANADRIAVIDGETLLVDGLVIRLRGITAPDRGDRCLPSMDCGEAASAAMAALVRDRRLECDLSGHDGAGRPLASCAANGSDLSHAIVASGWARATSGVPDLADLELRARRQGHGLWASGTTY
jgi:endonuclease YncB( thermonuclease family)